LALDDFAALEIINDQFRIITSKPIAKAFKVYKNKDKLIYEEIKKKEEGTRPVIFTHQPEFHDLDVGRDDGLNPKYNLDLYVVCPFNELAFAAAQAIIKNPGTTYNPLFIYGGTGLGKTHLIQGMGNQIKKADPKSIKESSPFFKNEKPTMLLKISENCQKT
jgi:chromosomal replication initiator protein